MPRKSRKKSRPVAPRGFDDGKEIADRFLVGKEVKLDTQGLEYDTARRLIDFCSGLVYGTGGRLQRISQYLYVLRPSGGEFYPRASGGGLDPPDAPDRSPLRSGGPSLGAAAAAPLPVEEWILADAVSAPRFDD